MTNTATRELTPTAAEQLLNQQEQREEDLFLCASNRAALYSARRQTARALEMDDEDGGSDAALPTVASYVAMLDALDPVGADQVRATLRREFGLAVPERAL